MHYLGLDTRYGKLRGCLLREDGSRALELDLVGGTPHLERLLQALDPPAMLAYSYEDHDLLLPVLNQPILKDRHDFRTGPWRLGRVAREAWGLAGRGYDRAHLLAWLALRARLLGRDDHFESHCVLAREWLRHRQEDVLGRIR
jgi:hypothetical protein